jgi:hypothetical protein
MSEWQTIDTAPQDGTDILVYATELGTGFPLFSVVHFEDWYQPEWITPEAGNIDFTPTHWVPLPAPPITNPVSDPPPSR